VAISDAHVKALIADSPLIDVPELMRSSPLNHWLRLVPDSLLDLAVAQALRRSAVAKGLAYYTLWSWGCPSFGLWRDWPAKRANDIRGAVREISCPTLALVSEPEGPILLRQAQTFIQAIRSGRKRLQTFNLERDGSNDHCQLDNLSRGQQVAFDWLDEIFDSRAGG
jgi:pimeloyl-ACP methyl ester carboxylesterase